MQGPLRERCRTFGFLCAKPGSGQDHTIVPCCDALRTYRQARGSTEDFPSFSVGNDGCADRFQPARGPWPSRGSPRRAQRGGESGGGCISPIAARGSCVRIASVLSGVARLLSARSDLAAKSHERFMPSGRRLYRRHAIRKRCPRFERSMSAKKIPAEAGISNIARKREPVIRSHGWRRIARVPLRT